MKLSEDDVRQMVRLLGETAALQGGHTEKKRYLMNGLCKLINVDAWIWSLGCQIKPGEPQVFVGFLHGGFTDERFSHFLSAVEHPDMARVASKFAEQLQDRKKLTTMRRHEIDPSQLAESSDAGLLWQKADIGSLMLSGFPLDETSISCVGLYRRLKDAPLDDRAKTIAHIILDEVPWLHLSGWPEDRGATVPQLYPRQRIVLNLLLDGLGRKQIADRMKITENTVSGYIKDIYRHFKVSSHVELMKKFLHAEVK